MEIAELKKIFSADQILEDSESLQYYGKDWTTYFDIQAKIVVFPKKLSEIQLLVKWARQFKMALVPSGGRTGLSGAAVATKGEVIVSFEKMNKIYDFNELNGTVKVEAGVVTEKLQDFAKSKGWLYPVDFAARGSSQIGGNIATNAGGIKVLRYGLTRDWVASLKVVTGSGEVLDLNNSLIKNATGYDFRHLFVGSEGTLGFIAEATIKLAPAAPQTQVFLLGVKGLNEVMDVFTTFRKKVTLQAFEFFSDQALKHVLHASPDLSDPLEKPAPFYTVIEVEIPNSESEEVALAAFETCLEKEWIVDGVMSQSENQAKTFWKYREQISESLARHFPYKNDIAVTISNVKFLIEDLDKILKQNYPNFEVVWFGHIGDGNLHINILRPKSMTKEAFVADCRKVDELIFKTIQKLNGSISAEHGVGLTKKSFLNYTRSKEEIELMKQVKSVFDPDGIMNPGKIF